MITKISLRKDKKKRRRTKRQRGRGKKKNKFQLESNPFADQLTQQEMDEYDKAHKEIMLAPKTRKMLDELCKDDGEECRNAIADLIPQNVKKMGKYTYKTIDGVQRLIFTPGKVIKEVAENVDKKVASTLGTPIDAHLETLKNKVSGAKAIINQPLSYVKKYREIGRKKRKEKEGGRRTRRKRVKRRKNTRRK